MVFPDLVIQGALENLNLNKKKGGRHCSVRPPNNQTNQPFEFEEPGGKTKNPQDSDSELKYMTVKVIQMFKYIFNALCAPLK